MNEKNFLSILSGARHNKLGRRRVRADIRPVFTAYAVGERPRRGGIRPRVSVEDARRFKKASDKGTGVNTVNFRKNVPLTFSNRNIYAGMISTDIMNDLNLPEGCFSFC